MSKELYMKVLEEYNKSGELIPIDSCEDGYIYAGIGRNFDVAFYVDGKFYGERYKFQTTFIDSELHWNTGVPYGTFVPLLRCEKYDKPFNFEYMENEDLQKRLNELTEELEK